MSYRGLRIVVWFYRILALLIALGGPALALIGAQTDATLRRIMIEQGMTPAPAGPGPLLLVIAALFIALALYTFAELLALLVDMAIAQRETADALARIRGKR